MSGGTVAAAVGGGLLGASVGGLATGAATALGGLAVNSIAGGGSSSGGGGSSGGSSGSGGLNLQQTQIANSIKYNEGPKFGGSKEQGISNPDMKLEDPNMRPEKAASKWQINSTPTQEVGSSQAQQDSGNVWASRLSKYLDYNSRSLG